MKQKKIVEKFKSEIQSMGLTEKESAEIIKSILSKLSSLQKKIILYRIIFLNDLTDLNRSLVGSHYSLDKENLINSMQSNGFFSQLGEIPYLLTVEVDKELIDLDSTVSNNILYPNEEEITIKNKGKNVKIINVERINSGFTDEIIRIKEIIDFSFIKDIIKESKSTEENSKIKKLLDSHLDEYNVTYTISNYTNNYRILFDIDGEIIAFYSFFSYNKNVESFFDQSFFWFLGLLSEEDQLFASKYFLTKYVPPYSPDFPKPEDKKWSIHDVIFGGITDLS
jgi:hypothetical protein